MHRGLHCLPGRVHEQFCEPFKHHLDLLGVGFSQVGEGKRYTDIIDASCDLFVGLFYISIRRKLGQKSSSPDA